MGTDVCDHCGARLGERTYSLLRLQTVFTRRRERISTDEEERRRSGFELEFSYRFSDHGDRTGHVQAAASTDREAVVHLSYGDSALVRLANVGRRKRKHEHERGFWLDTVEGRWLSEKKATDVTVDAASLEDAADVVRKKQVIPYVQDRRNILVLRLGAQVDEVAATTLRYAIERGIEAEFQLEDSELESQPLPDPHDRGRMVLIESAEGGAGVLRRLTAEPQALARVARRALDIIHIDPDTGADLDHAPRARERCEAACYDCLLSYGNQTWHRLIERSRVVDLLMAMSRSRVDAGAGGRTRADQRSVLEALAESSLERRFVEWLDAHGMRLPDRAQVGVADATARPDLVYDLPSGPVAVFVDGPVHDHAAQAGRDHDSEERLVDLGWLVVRVRYDGDWDSDVARFPSVFGTARSAVSRPQDAGLEVA